MIQSETDLRDDSASSHSYFAMPDEDEIFEQNIDAFDERMYNEYDDGIAHSNIDDHLEEDHDDEEHDDDDNIHPYTHNDELEDYDELEE